MIYVFKISNQPLYKIGMTNAGQAKHRLSTLQSGSPYIIEIYTTSDCQDKMERTLHYALRDYHLRGEWFELPITIANRLKRILRELERLSSLNQEDVKKYLLLPIDDLDAALKEVLF